MSAHITMLSCNVINFLNVHLICVVFDSIPVLILLVDSLRNFEFLFSCCPMIALADLNGRPATISSIIQETVSGRYENLAKYFYELQIITTIF